MTERIKNWFKKEDKKKTYVADAPDFTALAYWVFVLSVGTFLIMRAALNQKVALPFLLMFPAMVGIFFILFILPVRLFNFIITEIVLRVYLFHTQKGTPEETIVVIGKNEYRRPSFWISPNYDTYLILIVKYLRLLGKPFSIYYDSSLENLDEIMANKKIKTVYLVGHGRRHGFVIDGKTVVDYCRYQGVKYKKDYVYQIHCNHGKGMSLVEYVVPKENQQGCLPEHGYMSNITVNQLFIDKIVQKQGYRKIKLFLVKGWYSFMTMLIPIIVFFAWSYIFSRMVA